MALSVRELGRATLARQMLLSREKVTAIAAVERVAGLQAQLARPPFVGLWTRIADFEAGELVKALARRKVVRATLMRGTLHLVSARDYLRLRAPMQPWLTKAMESILRTRSAGYDREKVVAAAGALYTGGPRTFEEVRDHLVGLYPKGDVRAMGFTVRLQIPLVQVPEALPWCYPTVPRFTPSEAWLGKPLEPTGPGVLLERYLRAFGPASVADAQTWSGLAGLRAAMEELRPRLAVFRDERGRELFDFPDAPRPSADTPAPVRFLPEFDNVLLAHQDRGRVIAPVHKPKVFLPGLRVAPTFLVDGMVAGTWKLERKKTRALLTLAPFEVIKGGTRQELEAEAEALVRFAEPEADTWEVEG